MKRPDDLLETEYTPNPASAARAADRQHLARERQQAEARAAEQRRRAALEAQQQAAPIADDAQLRGQVEQLAGAWGLKRKGCQNRIKDRVRTP